MLKIEGRARGAEYVKRVVECYDEALRAIEAGRARRLAAGLKERLARIQPQVWEGLLRRTTRQPTSKHYGSAATRRKVYVGITKALAAVLRLRVLQWIYLLPVLGYQEQEGAV